MGQQKNTILWLGWILLVASLFYSMPRLYYLPEIRYNRIVVSRLKKMQRDDTQHIQWHQQLVDTMVPEALKGGIVFIGALCVLSFGLQPIKKNRRGKSV